MSFIKDQEVVPNHLDFLNYSATQKLKILAEQPFDLTLAEQLTPDRLKNYCIKACGYKFLFGTERVNDDVLLALAELAKEAHVLEKMQQMQDGEIVNYIENQPCENRPALHTATRDFFEHPRTTKKAQEATELAKKEIEKLKSFLNVVEKNGQFKEIISIGIGGSDLGPRATYFALEHLLKPNKKIHFISNVDPDDAAQVLKQTNLKEALVIVISKSGTTLETKINEDLIREKFKEQGLEDVNQFISITMPGTPMDDSNRYGHTFYLWDWIGGRYSVTSMVGGVMLAFAFGFDVYWEFLKGANAMDKVALEPDVKKNLPLLVALLGVWNRNFLNYPTVALIPYSQALLRYPAHIQQVEMESNGKSIDQKGQFVNFQTGSIIWGEPGTNGQHSFFQLLHQGTSIVPVMMIGYKKNQNNVDIQVEGTSSQEKLLSNLFAQSLALATGQKSDNPNQVFSGNRPSSILLSEKLTPFSLGALLSLFENMVAFQGFIWGINSFDQEGVQLGKVLATKIISRFAAKHQQSSNTDSYPLADAYLKHLENFS